MTKNPLYNALSAILYIVIVVRIMYYIGNIETLEYSLLMPVIFLSLFTLSVAVMGTIFFLKPVLLYLDRKKKEGVRLFLNTLLIFSVFPLGLSLLIILGIL